MSGISEYLEKQWLNTLRGVGYAGTSVYVALMTTASTDDTPGLEPNDPDYTRKVVTFNAPVKDEEKSTLTNDIELLFPVATRDWGTLTHFTLFDAENGGNMLYHGALEVPKTVTPDDQIRIRVNELKIRLD